MSITRGAHLGPLPPSVGGPLLQGQGRLAIPISPFLDPGMLSGLGQACVRCP